MKAIQNRIQRTCPVDLMSDVNANNQNVSSTCEYNVRCFRVTEYLHGIPHPQVSLVLS
jgi:hypothetical protein